MAKRLGGLGSTLIGAAAGEIIGRKTAGRGLLGAGLGVLATRLATRSIPGALMVGGGLLAKSLWDKRQQARRDGAVDDALTAQRKHRLDDADLTEHEPLASERGRLKPIPPRPTQS